MTGINQATSNAAEGDDTVSSATTTAPGTPLSLADIVLKKQRSTSNSSSESSGDSSVYSASGGGGGSGRDSPMSPASVSSTTTVSRAIGSPVKSANGVKGIPKLELFRQSGTQYEPQTMVTRNLREDTSTSANYIHLTGDIHNGGSTNFGGNGEMIFYIERPLEKIEERQTESESELDNEGEETKTHSDDKITTFVKAE